MNADDHPLVLASGLDILLKSSYPDAAHDSAARDPPKCFPGTRLQHIEDITGWATAFTAERRFRMMWLQGPAGVGKSALAQTCAERLSSSNKLAAAFFFSRPNDRQDSTRLLTSIAYQLTTRYPSYRDKLDEKIRHNPTLVHKTIAVQFQELIVAPLLELQEEGQAIGEGIILIDGLDECAGEDAQCAIIDIISTSIRDQSTPFIWALFSRPEPRIVAKISVPRVDDLCWRLTLPVSRDADSEIELYIRDAFRRIRIQFGIPSAALWPSEENVRYLVDRSAGLFIYPASVIRFVGEGGPLGPEEQLRLVLRLPSKLSGNPWSHLDAFYTLIMDLTPEVMLPNTLKLLAVYTCARHAPPVVVAAVLDFSLPTFTAALSKLHSVAKLSHSKDGLPISVNFYHASFMDFLEDSERSTRFCAKTPELYADLLVDVIRLSKRGFKNVIAPWSAEEFHFSETIFYLFWPLGSYAKLDRDLLEELVEFNYQELSSGGLLSPRRSIAVSSIQGFYKNIPPAWLDKIIRPLDSPQGDNPNFPFIMGISSKRVALFVWSSVRPPVCCLNFENYAIMKLQQMYQELLAQGLVRRSQNLENVLERMILTPLSRSEREMEEEQSPHWDGASGTAETTWYLERPLEEWLQRRLQVLREEKLGKQLKVILENLLRREERLQEEIEEELGGLPDELLQGLLVHPRSKLPLHRRMFRRIRRVLTKCRANLIPC